MVQIRRVWNPNHPGDRERSHYEYLDGRRVVDPDTLEYIRSLVIPPAYRDIVIYYEPRSTPKILYRGVDDRGRPQVIYSKAWSDKAHRKKLCNLIGFGRMLPQMQADMRRHLQSERFTRNKVISMILRVVEQCNIRIGQTKYQDLYKSYGVTTLTKEHLKFRNGQAHFDFVGKKGARNLCCVNDPQLVGLLEQLVRQNNSNYIFSYHLDGVWQEVSALDVNDWLKGYHQSFTSKMFRTWAGNLMLIRILRDHPDPTTQTQAQRKKVVVAALREISEQLHNTPTIARKSYVDSELLDLYNLKPRSYRSQFITNTADPRLVFMAWLRKKCGVETDDDADRLLADLAHEEKADGEP